MASSGEFVLEITGNDRARVQASCELDAEDGSHTDSFSGAPPIRKRMAGHALICTVRQTAESGRINVLVVSPTGNTQSLGTGGKGSTLRLSAQ